MIETNYKDIFEIEKKVLDDIDPDLYPFLEFWRSEKSEIIVHTSGSTGKPKEISILKKQMIILFLLIAKRSQHNLLITRLMFRLILHILKDRKF